MAQQSIIVDKGTRYYLKKTTVSYFDVEETVKNEKAKGRKVKVKKFQMKAGEGMLVLPCWAIYSTNSKKG